MLSLPCHFMHFHYCTHSFTASSPLTVLDEVCQDPVHEVGDPSVDPWVARLCAPVTEADDADQEPGSGLCVIEHQGAATVALTRVTATISITSTQEHLSDRLEIRLEQDK